jgi:nitrous oxidase accessory protein NosD
MSISATCATILGVLAAAKGGESITLKGDCGAITITRSYPRPVSIQADGASVRGLFITGGQNISWRGGTISAPQGPHGAGRDGYGILIRNAAKVSITGALITNAKKSVVLDGAKDVTLNDNRFQHYGEDGVIASITKGLTVLRNTFSDQIGKPTECSAAGKITLGLSRRDCVARGGAWVDGYHNDAVQMRNGVADALIAHNQVTGETQGITQMDKKGDAPLENIRIEFNTVMTDGYHPITLGDCKSCTIRMNTVRRAKGSSKKSVILAQPGVLVCGNTVPDMPSTAGPRCKDAPAAK